LGKFLIKENSVSGNLLRRQRDAFGWGLIEDGSTHTPAQERLERLQGFVGRAECPALFDGRDDFNHIVLDPRARRRGRPGQRPARVGIGGEEPATGNVRRKGICGGWGRPKLSRRLATYVGKILKGANPADLPVEQPTKLEFVFNLKTAKKLELVIPREFLLLADEVIE